MRNTNKPTISDMSLKDKFVLMPQSLATMVCLCRKNSDHRESNLVELSLFEMIYVVFRMEALTR